MNAILKRADQKRETALHILDDLKLMERWRAFGRPVLVGAVAYDLVVKPDIDMEIYCPTLRIADGFEVLKACAENPRVLKARFSNRLNSRDKALYWKLYYEHTDGEVWTIDMWTAPEDYPLPRAEYIVEPMLKAITPETREAILCLKEAHLADTAPYIPSIDLYRAVISDGVRTEADWQDWLATHEVDQLTSWKP